MRGRFVILVVLNFLFISMLPSTIAQEEVPEWRSVGIDPETWTDGPVEEDTPMKESFEGNAILVIEVTYHTSLTSEEFQGNITIELFEQWAPITTSNIIQHIETELYDGIFFHRVVDDFVIQSGDPECKTNGIYPMTSPQCSNGGTGETIPLEHDENLSHVDGAMGMARGAEQDSADSQWYITDQEQHGLDPENRDDEGYVTFGIVRNGMSHVRAIAMVPTSDDLTGSDLDNPFSSAGRPVYEVHISKVEMIGVIPSEIADVPEEGSEGVEEQSFFGNNYWVGNINISVILILAGVAFYLIFIRAKEDRPEEIILTADEIS